MPQPEFIRVLIVFNAEDIVNDLGPGSQDPKNPTWVEAAAKYIYVTVKQANTVSGSTGAELNITAHVDDEIRWRETTYSLDDNFAALLYDYESTSNLISKPQPSGPAQARLPFSTATSAGDTKYDATQKVQNSYWSANVTNPGSGSYTFSFQIIDRDGNLVGYYKWDPFLTITG
ncbi:AidA/PixA family protein [Kitasatospora sp. NPDC091335]|uniref:AidA/PixA family protein n=1 Tax=Kitasatospora sp. NPDC091335 TaxID=3364085 RepID=UPI00381C3716